MKSLLRDTAAAELNIMMIGWLQARLCCHEDIFVAVWANLALVLGPDYSYQFLDSIYHDIIYTSLLSHTLFWHQLDKTYHCIVIIVIWN